MQNETVLNQLQFLLGTLRDGKKGFADAAAHATSPDLAQLLTARSEQRGTFERQIAEQITALGGKPDQHSSLGAALHRTWLNIRDALSGRDDHAVLAECVRGEGVAVENFTDVLSEMELPADLRALIQHQFAAVKEGHTQLLDMQNQVG